MCKLNNQVYIEIKEVTKFEFFSFLISNNKYIAKKIKISNSTFLWTIWEDLETEKVEKYLNLLIGTKSKIIPPNLKTYYTVNDE